MDEILKNVILISAMGSVLALILLCIKPLTKRLFSPKWQYYIWLTVLIVMVLPIKVSLQNEPAHITPAENTQVQTEQITPVEANQEQKQPVALSDLSQSPAIITPGIPINIMRFSGFLWLAVAVLLLGYKLVKYTVFLREIKKFSVIECGLENIPRRLTVRKTELLDAPLIVGLIKPVLYLPQAEIKEKELDYILLHELTHYRRHDLLYKWFAMLVSSIHWFNPLVYIVSKQIDEECEVSCDYEVCKNLSEMQKKDYMVMILDFVQTSIRKKRPLTTQMASSKKILKRRFMVMKTKKVTSKFVSVLSVILALAMLSTTVFASGVLSGLTEDNYTIEIINNGEIIELDNKPFIENGEVYVPLREMFEQLNVINDIKWDNGQIYITITQNGASGLFGIEIGQAYMKLKHIQPSEIYSASFNTSETLAIEMKNVPILRKSDTYISLQDMNYMLYSFFNIRTEDNSLYELVYDIYDKDGNKIDFFRGTTVITSRYENTTPEYTVDQFFKNVEFGQIDQAQQYCEDPLKSFHDYSEFFQPQKIISDIKIDYTKNSFGEISAEVYTESSNADIGFIHWKLFLIQTDNDQYLINGYESVTDVTFGENGNIIDTGASSDIISYNKNETVKISNSATELISWESEPEIFVNPYSDFLKENISQSLSNYNFSDTYSYEYILRKYNDNNSEVTFQYQIKLNGEDKMYILSMVFENRNNNWIKYDSYVVDPVLAEVVE